ncbi:ribonuclease [Aestuariivirga sp.]|uniref:ribonuclease T2 family protein n=1 Tax=Aestuariivirga sp. TaxID=2650926 RepID=UPI0025C241C1|nr:ribonuclease [Aestuariivirga sp.]
MHRRAPAVAALALLAVFAPARGGEPLEGSFIASRSCAALLSIRKNTNPGNVTTAPGTGYRLLARNRKKPTHVRIEIPGARPPERWVAADCGKAGPAAAKQAAPAQPEPVTPSYVLALSWQPAFCEANPGKRECRRQTAARYDANYLSLHGLWPQPPGLAYCNLSPAVRAAGEGGRWRDIPPVELSLSTRADLEHMMPGSQSMLERHEWAKHGSCYPADAETYFRDSFRLMKELNASPVAGVFQRNIGRRVSANDIRAAFDQGFGPGAGNRVRVACRDDGDRRLIAELTISLKGDIQGGSTLSDLMLAANPVDPGCPAGVLDPVGAQ